MIGRCKFGCNRSTWGLWSIIPIYIYMYCIYIYIYIYIYIDDFPIKASIFRGFPIAMFWLLEGNQQKQGFFSGEYTWMAIRSELDRNHDGHGVIDDHPLISKAHDVHTWLTYSVVIIQNKGMDRRKKDAKAAKNPRVGPENLEPRNFFWLIIEVIIILPAKTMLFWSLEGAEATFEFLVPGWLPFGWDQHETSVTWIPTSWMCKEVHSITIESDEFMSW